jgi:photosystem II stability/assembly factor-like uncharacterized protein
MNDLHILHRFSLFCLIVLLLLCQPCKKNPTEADKGDLCDYISPSGYNFPNCSGAEVYMSDIIYNVYGQRIAWQFKITCSPSGKTYTGRFYDIKYEGDEVIYYKAEINGQSCTYGNPPSFALADLTGLWGNSIFDINVNNQGQVSGNNINSTWQIDEDGLVTGNGTITFIDTAGVMTKNISWNLEMSWDKWNLNGTVSIDYPGYENVPIWFGRSFNSTWPPWHSQTSPTSNSLHGVAFADEKIGVAVGDEGTIIRTTNGGVTWSVVNSDVIYNLYGIHFINESTGIIVGRFGTILRSSDAGLTWQRQDSLTNKQLKDVYFSGEQDGIIAGWGILLRSANGGINWTDVSNGLINSYLEDVCGIYNNGFAVGSSGTIIRYTGSDWEKLPRITSAPLNGITVSYNFPTVAVGGSYENGGIILSSMDNGDTWTTIENQNIPVLNAVAAHYASISTSFYSKIIIVGENGTILANFQANYGKNLWIYQKSDSQEILNDVAFAGDKQVVAVGEDGTILWFVRP